MRFPFVFIFPLVLQKDKQRAEHPFAGQNTQHERIITWDFSWQSRDTEEETDKESYSKGQHDVEISMEDNSIFFGCWLCAISMVMYTLYERLL